MSEPDLTWARAIYKLMPLDRQLRASVVLSVTHGSPREALADLKREHPDDYALLLEHVEIPKSWMPE